MKNIDKKFLSDIYLDHLIKIGEDIKKNRGKLIDEKLLCQKIAFYGIKAIGLSPEIESKDPKYNEYAFALNNLILTAIEELTPKEFLQVFPLDKIYDGDKFDCKDYFSSMETINEYGIDRRIEDAGGFLFDFMNKDVHKFLFKVIKTMDYVIEDNGGIGCMNQFMHDMGILPLLTYKGKNGEEYAVNKFGKPVKLKQFKNNNHNFTLIK